MRVRTISVALTAGFGLLFATACHKKAASAPPPPAAPAARPAPPAKPEISLFQAEPAGIQRGQSTTLRWSVKNATDVSINQGIGTVSADGTRRVYPNDSTTFTLVAKGPGGSADATASIDVSLPAPAAKPAVSAQSLADRLNALLNAYYDYDKSSIRPDARTALTKDASSLEELLKTFGNTTLVVEGSCDERGSAEYNLALGDRRAAAAKDFLVQLGVPTANLKTISYGKERPVCTDHDEACWQQNRRAHVTAAQ